MATTNLCVVSFSPNVHRILHCVVLQVHPSINNSLTTVKHQLSASPFTSFVRFTAAVFSGMQRGMIPPVNCRSWGVRGGGVQARIKDKNKETFVQLKVSRLLGGGCYTHYKRLHSLHIETLVALQSTHIFYNAGYMDHLRHTES